MRAPETQLERCQAGILGPCLSVRPRAGGSAHNGLRGEKGADARESSPAYGAEEAARNWLPSLETPLASSSPSEARRIVPRGGRSDRDQAKAIDPTVRRVGWKVLAHITDSGTTGLDEFGRGRAAPRRAQQLASMSILARVPRRFAGVGMADVRSNHGPGYREARHARGTRADALASTGARLDEAASSRIEQRAIGAG